MKILTLKVKVYPNSSSCRLELRPKGSLYIYVKSAPTGGKANEELLLFLAHFFSIEPKVIRITKGTSTPNKEISIFLKDQEQYNLFVRKIGDLG